MKNGTFHVQKEWDMNRQLSILQSVVPDLIAVATMRFNVLSAIAQLAPVGRRTLAEQLQLSERVLRGETDFLRAQQLIQSTSKGMVMTNQGTVVLSELQELLTVSRTHLDREQQLARRLGFAECHIVPGDLSDTAEGLVHLAKRLSAVLVEQLPKGNTTIAVTGGTTLAALVPYISFDVAQNRRITVVPARGGGEDALHIQSNTVSDLLAHRLSGEYIPLFVPEHVSPETYDALINEHAVARTIAMMQQATCLIYSVGSAVTMAERRTMPAQLISMLKERKAVGEAFGVFFNQEGQVIHRLARVGLHLEDLESIPYSILVAGGHQKAPVLAAYAKLAPSQTILVTDEGLANSVLTGEPIKNNKS